MEAFFSVVADYWLTLISIVLLIIASGFFSGSETALTAASPARMHTLESNGDERAGVVGALIKRRDRLIGALLIGNNLVNILASSLTTSLFLAVFGDSGVAFATLLMTALLVIFSEVLPKRSTTCTARAGSRRLTVTAWVVFWISRNWKSPTS